ncbi:MAG: hypothetical protein AABX51_00265 [Nanoarchaeota archaeon]
MTILKFFVFLSLLSILAATAIADDFTASGTSTFKTCSCEPIASQIYVQNTGSGLNQIKITSTGKFSSWITIAPDFMLLLPGESAVATQFIKPDCSQSGLQDIGLRFEGNGVVKDLRQQISVAQCQQVNNTAQPSPNVDEDMIFNLLTYTTIGLTVLLVLILVALIVRVSIHPRKTEKKVEVESIVIKRTLRYPWEKSFKAKKVEVQKTKEIKVEEIKKDKSPFSNILFIILVIVVIIFLAWMFWYLFQPTSIIIPGNGTNGSVYVFNGSPITGI